MVGAGGMETWGGRRSAAYASMCGPLLPFLREGNPPATCQNSDNLEVVGRPSKSCQNSDTIIEKIDTKKELAKIAGVSHDTIARVHESGRCTLPFRGGNIKGRPAGGGPGFSRDGRHVSGYGPESGRAARAVRGRGGRLRATYTRSRDALSGSTGNGFVSGALFPLVASRAVCVGRIYSGLWRNYG